jgi:hypothetical protein
MEKKLKNLEVRREVYLYRNQKNSLGRQSLGQAKSLEAKFSERNS